MKRHNVPVEGELFADDTRHGGGMWQAAPRHDLDPLFDRLSRSAFRSRFRLDADSMAYAVGKGCDVIRSHAARFISSRLAPASPPNDGRQTPMRGHPVFIAQHAMACCCRGCFEKWHGIPRGRRLTDSEQRYAVDVVMEWIRRQLELYGGGARG